MSLQDNVTLLDPFTHTQQKRDDVWNFDFIKNKKSKRKGKVQIDQSFCTLITVGGKFLEKKNFTSVLRKIDDIRRIIRDLNTY